MHKYLKRETDKRIEVIGLLRVSMGVGFWKDRFGVTSHSRYRVIGARHKEETDIY